MADNPVERLKELDRERQQLLSNAKKDALARAQSAIDELNALGFSFQIVERGQAASPRARQVTSSRRGTRKVKDAPCPVCKFKTSPPHDARKHRGQGGRKKPFTAVELKEMGLDKT